jgi:hypothetical protein
MASYPCPICNRLKAFPMWLDTEPPDTCAFEPTCRIKEDCPRLQIEAERRRLVPECFGPDDALIPGQFMDMLEKWLARIPADPQAVARVQREYAIQREREIAEGEDDDVGEY